MADLPSEWLQGGYWKFSDFAVCLNWNKNSNLTIIVPSRVTVGQLKPLKTIRLRLEEWNLIKHLSSQWNEATMSEFAVKIGNIWAKAFKPLLTFSMALSWGLSFPLV